MPLFGTERMNEVSLALKANIYFDGKVVSHTFFDPQGHKHTLGLIYPGSYTFNTEQAEIMKIISGSCEVKIKGEQHWTLYVVGTEFRVPEYSAFEIKVENKITEYLCSFV